MRQFGIVTDALLRSGKYQAGELRACVAQHSIRRVIDLRDRPPLLSARTYAQCGVDLCLFPLAEYAPISPRQCLALLDLLANPVVTLLHCWKGSHRTGAVVALYRRSMLGWSPAAAWAEMAFFDFGPPDRHHELFVSVFGDWRP